MRLTTEKVLNDIETYLEETAELPWGTAHIILMEAQDQINSLQRQLDYKELTDEKINVVAILQDAEIVPVGHEIWKTGEEFNKYKRIVLATAKALRKAQE